MRLSAVLCIGTASCMAQKLPVKWEDLTSADFQKAIQKSFGVCLLPMGSIEKFGPSGPLGTNLYLDRIVSEQAAAQEYAVVFPSYFAAGTNDVSNFPGTIAYSARLQYELLDETVREMARNGCTKVLIVNGHTGNIPIINLYIDSEVDKPHDYVVYSVYGLTFKVVPGMPGVDRMTPASQPSRTGVDGHGGEERIAALFAYRPDLIHLDRAHDEPGGGGRKLPLPAGVTDGMARMAELPNGYEGDASGATAARGKALVDFGVDTVVRAIRAVKGDDVSRQLQKSFSEKRINPEVGK